MREGGRERDDGGSTGGMYFASPNIGPDYPQTSNTVCCSYFNHLGVIAYYEELEDIMVMDYVLSVGVQDPTLAGRWKRRGMISAVLYIFYVSEHLRQ